MSTTAKSIKGTAIQAPKDDPSGHVIVLRQLKEVAEIGQRLRGDPLDSFVRVSELVSAGLARFVNGTVQKVDTTIGTPGGVPTARQIITPLSVQGGGDLSADRTLTLVGDTGSPGSLAYYGTNGSSTKGWYSIAGVTQKYINKGAFWTGGSSAMSLPTNPVAVEMPADGTIVEATILTTGGPGACSISIWKGPYSTFPPTISGDITGGVNPAISPGIKYTNTVLSGWTVSVTAGDILYFQLQSVSTFTSVTIYLRIRI